MLSSNPIKTKYDEIKETVRTIHGFIKKKIELKKKMQPQL